ncbi:MAG: PDZ domain-containing protein, partial [Candidatus Eisenbacteria bacterium]|nr:PDZ domain-containing protein [Candidatus Eisenbacteria bacterium]
MRRRFLVASVFALLFALGWWAGRVRASGDLYSRLDTFIEVLHKVEDNYVEHADPERLIGGAVRGMLRGLDPLSEYLEPRALRERLASGGDADIGAVIGYRGHLPAVVAPLPGGPAARAGLMAGDLLLQVDGHSTDGWTSEETAWRLRGARGTRVRLSVARRGDDAPRQIVVERDLPARAAPPEAYVVESGVGYARLRVIGDSSAAGLKPLLQRLRSQGATRLVLDLRSCVGGTPREGADIAQLFLARGTLIATLRSRDSEQRLTATLAGTALEWPLAVLVDGGSSSAAEVVSGALQDLDRALEVGRRRTFGLGSTQSDFPLTGGTARLLLTTAATCTPSGRPIPKLDVPAASDEEEASPDSAATDSAGRKAYRTRAGR